MPAQFEQHNILDEQKSGEIEKRYHDAEKRLWEAFRALTHSGLVYENDQAFSSPRSHAFLNRKRKEIDEKSWKGIIIKGKEQTDITRSELLELAGLPEDFILDPLPEFPSSEEVERLVKERTANLKLEKNRQPTKEYFEALKDLPYPRIVCDAILRASKYHSDLGFNAQRYESFSAERKAQYDKVSEILQRE